LPRCTSRWFNGGEGSKAKVVEELLREFHSSILGELKSEVDEARRYLRLLAWLNTYLEGRGIGRVVITGGFAVEVYTARTRGSSPGRRTTPQSIYDLLKKNSIPVSLKVITQALPGITTLCVLMLLR